MPIRQLAPDVAAKIAAGEVVERPASVVKELIENSIDAGATQIRVDLTNGGLQLIRVTDTGSGIPVDELSLALSRHATSKVSQIDDLEHIRSLGFRGEALASIAAVAEVTLLSRHREATQGAQVTAMDGRISEAVAAASPEGSTLTVRNLFSAVPARLKFLKSRNTEVSHCHHLLEQYALAYPEIRFSAFSDGRQILSTPGDGQLPSVLIEVHGLQVAEQMVVISSLDGNDADTTRPVVSGYVSLPTCYKSTRQHISFFVNRRWVLSRMLNAAVDEAYHSLLLPGRHPIAVINITLDPTLVDVNVHPAKTEIRFLRERRVFAAVMRAVRGALLEGAEMPKWGEGNVGSQSRRVPVPIPGVPTSETEVTSTTDEEALSFPADNPWLTVTEEESGTKPPLVSRLWQSHVRKAESERMERTGTSGVVSRGSSDRVLPWDKVPSDRVPSNRVPTRGTPTMDDGGGPKNERSEILEPDGSGAPTRGILAPASKQVEMPLVGTPGTGAGTLVPASNHAGMSLAGPSMVGVPLVGTLSPDGTLSPASKPGRLPTLRVIGQLSQSYIVTEGPDGMYLIDQHAAHERILLERMVAALKARTPISQLVLTPIQLELSPAEVEGIEEHLLQLEQIGFDLEISQHNVLAVKAVPNVLIKQMNARSLRELLVGLTAAEQGGHTETWEEHALANVACKAAIKANYFLTVSEMREMMEQLEQTQAPYSCCHGRPTMVHFTLSALEREFGRR